MNTRTSIIKTGFLFIMAGVILTACGGQKSTPITGQSQPDAASQPSVEEIPTVMVPSVQPAIEESTADAVQPISVADALGRAVAFENPPLRIALAGKSLAIVGDAVYLFPEAKERLVVLGKANQDTASFESLLDPAYTEKAVLETDISAEQVAAYTPDLVLMKSSMAESLGAGLQSLQIPVVYLDLETPEQYARDLANLGAIFQNEARSEELNAYYQDRLAMVQEKTKDLGEDEKPRVLLVYYDDRDGAVAFNVPPLQWIQTLMVQSAGGVPVWQDAQLGNGWTKVNLEQIAVWNPDQIYLVAYFNNPSEIVENLKQDPQWQALSAVQNGQLFAFPKDNVSWDQSNPRWIIGQMWLAATMHPQLFPDLDIKQEMRSFYEQLYGIGAETFEGSILPRLQGDVD